MTKHMQLFAGDHAVSFAHNAGHVGVFGASGTGKTQLIAKLAQAKLKSPYTGLCVIDPDGDLSPPCLEYVANTQNNLGWRAIHYLRPASDTYAFALPLLYARDRTPLLCHQAAVRACAVFEQAVNFGSRDPYGPRLSKMLLLGLYGLVITGRPIIDLPALFTLGAEQLRDLVASAMPYEFMSDELRSLDVLNPRSFLEYRDALISRLMPLFSNPIMRRVFGPQKPVDIARVLQRREVVFLDLSGLEHKDAVLIGTAFVSCLFHEALQRPANVSAHSTLIIDEVFDYITADLARAFDRLRKRNIQLLVALQRLGQLQTGDNADDKATVLNAIIGNTATKIVFALRDPDDAEYMMRVLFSGWLDLAEWKPNSDRPVATGQKRDIVRSSSHAKHDATQESVGVTRSRTKARGTGTADAFMQASGSGSAAGQNSGQAMSLAPGLAGALGPPLAFTLTDGLSGAHSDSKSTGDSHAKSEFEMEAEGEAHSIARGTSTGTSDIHGVSEVFTTVYQWMPSQMYSLQEQQYRLLGELMNLPHRECFLRVASNKPFRARTADLNPTFRSAHFKRIMLPLFLTNAAARSPYISPVHLVDAQIAARITAPPPPPVPDTDFSKPEPMPLDPVIHAPQTYATEYWKTRPPADTEKPAHESSESQAGKFRVIDGGLDGDKGK